MVLFIPIYKKKNKKQIDIFLFNLFTKRPVVLADVGLKMAVGRGHQVEEDVVAAAAPLIEADSFIRPCD